MRELITMRFSPRMRFNPENIWFMMMNLCAHSGERKKKNCKEYFIKNCSKVITNNEKKVSGAILPYSFTIRTSILIKMCVMLLLQVGSVLKVELRRETYVDGN